MRLFINIVVLREARLYHFYEACTMLSRDVFSNFQPLLFQVYTWYWLSFQNFLPDIHHVLEGNQLTAKSQSQPNDWISLEYAASSIVEQQVHQMFLPYQFSEPLTGHSDALHKASQHLDTLLLHRFNRWSYLHDAVLNPDHFQIISIIILRRKFCHHYTDIDEDGGYFFV